MKVSGLVPLLLLAACATTPAQMMAGEPYRSYTSTKGHAEIGQCIAMVVPGASVIPGTTETVVMVQNPDGPILLAWRIKGALAGSSIDVWRANNLVPGIGKAEECF